MDGFEKLLGGYLTVLFLVPVMLQALAFIYIALRVREPRTQVADPLLGIKAAYHFFFTSGIFLILAGLTTITIDLMDGALEKNPRNQAPFQNQFDRGRVAPQIEKETWNAAKRTGSAFVASGMLFCLLFFLLLHLGTNERRFPNTRRAFVGLRLSAAGLVVMITVTVLLVLLFQSDPTTRSFEPLIGILIIWVPTLFIHLILMRLYAVHGPTLGSRHRGISRDEEDED